MDKHPIQKEIEVYELLLQVSGFVINRKLTNKHTAVWAKKASSVSLLILVYSQLSHSDHFLKWPPPVSDHFVNNRFVSQLNTVSRGLL